MQRRKAEIFDHPLRKTKAVVEIVQIHFGCEHVVRRRNLKLTEEVRTGQLNFFRFVKHGVGRNGVDDETKRFLVLWDGKDTVDDMD
jgi:hypothetical protein